MTLHVDSNGDHAEDYKYLIRRVLDQLPFPEVD